VGQAGAGRWNARQREAAAGCAGVRRAVAGGV
jgi:hypothetical protein